MSLPPQSVARDTSADAAGAQAALQSAIRKAALRFVPLLTIAYHHDTRHSQRVARERHSGSTW